MKLELIISGGQTSADQAGLIAAKALGITTSGTAPKNWRTERGSEAWLADFGLCQSPSYDFAPRTRQNVYDADITCWFGFVGSPGYWCTSKAADQYIRPFDINPSAEEFKELADQYRIINIAGNRFSKNQNTIILVFKAFEGIGLDLATISPDSVKLLRGEV